MTTATNLTKNMLNGIRSINLFSSIIKLSLLTFITIILFFKKNKSKFLFILSVYFINYLSIIPVDIYAMNFINSSHFNYQKFFLGLIIYFALISLLDNLIFASEFNSNTNKPFFPFVSYFSSKISELATLIFGITSLVISIMSAKENNPITTAFYAEFVIPILPIAFSLKLINSKKTTDKIYSFRFVLTPILLLSSTFFIALILIKSEIVNFFSKKPFFSFAIILVILIIMFIFIKYNNESLLISLALLSVLNILLLLYPLFVLLIAKPFDIEKFIAGITLSVILCLFINVKHLELHFANRINDLIVCYFKDSINYFVIAPSFTLIVNNFYHMASISKNSIIFITTCLIAVPIYLIYLSLDYLNSK